MNSQSKIGDAVRYQRKLERSWRADVKSKDKWAAFDKQRKITQAIIKKREREYYHLLFTEKASNPKEVFNIANALLARKNISPLPECSSITELANDFNKFFVDKITTIRNNIINTQFNGIKPTPVEPVNEANISEMSSFQSILERDVKRRIRKLPSKSCELDPILTTLLKSMVDAVTPVITCIINMSLLSGEFCQNLKLAHLKPLIKKTGLDLIFKSFCPVSNLSYISKLVERFAADQLADHVAKNGLSEKFQSAYRALHSTETALTHVSNDILLNMDNQKSTCLVLLDLSAAFNMLDHETLLNHLQNRFRITGVVLKWIKSYLSDRFQAVVLKNEEGETAMSNVVKLSMGVPQGSVLGPLLFTLFTTPLGDICRWYDQDFHLYADDTQLYASFIASSEESRESCMFKMNSCVVEISQWMSMNLLKLNEDKSEIMFIATHQQLAKFLPQIGSSVRLNGTEIRHSSSV